MVRIGVLALQGDFAEHKKVLEELGATAVEVRTVDQLAALDGLILPGGESSTVGKLLEAFGLLEPVRALVEEGLPTLATCAGLVLLAREATEKRGALIGTMDLQVSRNAFGRQRESFEVDLDVPALGQKPVHAVFIRAPAITAHGTDVDVLARTEDGTIVAARQGNQVAAAFHPEISGEHRFHKMLLDLVSERKQSRVP
ncbi:MAG TPA: pyridoxal 5'-phosphate synthase glutaminase subunit PdxT [Chloroflexota bacterium]|jgi:5'-phosphate synthase pdxT subunit|nr:pyridoxal 5'-phosphate synthase glutaminase subunit PdxT [Chloroflexota bacterium]